MSSACPSSERLVEFATGAADDFSAEMITTHIAGCPQCSTIVKSLMQSTPTQPPAEPPPTANEPAPRRKRRDPNRKRRPQQEAPPQQAPAPESPAPAEAPAAGGAAKMLPWILTAIAAAAAIVSVAGANLGWFGGGAEQPDIVETDPGDAGETVVPEDPAPTDVTDPGDSTETEPPEDPVVPPPKERVGFRMGEFNPEDPIDTIKVSLEVGENGEALAEGVDLHLGFGFPLRLYPVGTSDRDPAFAAFPQVSSVDAGLNAVNPGETATFEFQSQPKDPGLDELRTTPALLSDLTLADIHGIGIASKGASDWVLQGYTIEVNGKLYASNDSAEMRASEIQKANKDQVQTLLPAHESLTQEVTELQAYVDTGFAGDADKEDLEAKKAELTEAAGPLAELAGRVAGTYPWFREEADEFQPADVEGPVAKDVTVTLITGGDDKPGTTNPVYLKVGGQKHLLTSEVDFLGDDPGEQKFRFSAADLAESPISVAALDEIGIGAVGSDRRFGDTPDRAKVQRVIVEADGNPVYDSEDKPLDRRTLDAIWLIPPAHRDDSGQLVENESTEVMVHLWNSGMKLEQPIVPVLPPEPVPLIPVENPFAQQELDLQQGQLDLAQDQLQLERDKLALERQRLLQNLLQGINPFGGSRRVQPGLPVPIVINFTPPTPPIPPVIQTNPSPVVNNATIRNVKILQPGLLQHLDRLTVQWDVDGNTSRISQFRVSLNVVSPHLGPVGKLQGFAARGTLAATGLATGNRRTLTLPPLNLTSGNPNLVNVVGNAIMHCYLQPEIAALDSNGALVPTTPTVTGPLSPVVPARPGRSGSSTRTGVSGSSADWPLFVQLGPRPDLQTTYDGTFPLNAEVGIPGSQVPGFQIAGDGFGLYGPLTTAPFPNTDRWLAPTAIDFSIGQPPATSTTRGSEAWFLHAANNLGKETVDSQSWKFARYPQNLGTTSWPSVVSAAPSTVILGVAPTGHMDKGSKHITVQYNGFEQYVPGTNSLFNMHFVAHAGFIGIDGLTAPPSGTATIGARVIVTDLSLPVVPFNAGGLYFPSANDYPGQPPNGQEVMRFTIPEVTLSKGNNLALIDIPILLMDTNTNRYNSLGYTFDTVHPSTAVPPGPLNQTQTLNLMANLPTPPTAHTGRWNSTGAPAGLMVSVTLMIEQRAPSTNEGVAIFGARFAPKP